MQQIQSGQRSGTSAGKDDANGAENDLEIKPEAPIFNVAYIQRDVAIKGWILSGLNLPEARDTRSHVEPTEMGELVLTDFADEGWARTDDAHGAIEYVKKLGQFVKGVFAQVRSNSCDARVAFEFEEDAFSLIHVHEFSTTALGVLDHGAELYAAEDVAFAPDAF